MNRNNKKKVLLIEAAVIALIVLVLTVAVVVDTINNKASVTLNNQQAQEIIQQSFEKLPEPLAKTANKVVSGTKFDIESVTDGAEKEIIVSVSYETRDVLAVYKKNKNELFSSAYDYYNELKIQEAKKLIRQGQYNISQISDLLGFDSPQYFSRCFKKFVRMTPREYQQSIRQ